jgi:hypothetical protein
MKSRQAVLVGGVAMLALVAAACGSSSKSSSNTTAATTVATATTAPTATTATGASTATTAGGSTATTGAGSTATTAATTGSGPPADAIAVPIGLAFSAGATYGLLDQPSAAGVKLAVKEINDAGGFQVAGVADGTWDFTVLGLVVGKRERRGVA